ncbi:multicopper oxidase domain-containing protein [Sphaerisporangium krabiense]|uniref:FtsP/CotA-like multicopper oxidase with cupredoxin domain n=1 Tax=Sphaerisporangium krabiense TaxID=763782 RepID=A0A7W9DUZ9_9ACTN|nr:multicopper oxidase domain-containing protein [Sphaerisporangium krabiense]MBB5630910.1 FtsP/CotA-like multicopper oxidase with cupredoxin domain [Sphaerisporangium krabiense]
MRTVMRRVLVPILVAAGLTVPASPAHAADVAIDLCAAAGTLTLPGPVTVNVWGFARAGSGGSCAGVTPSVPGPVLTAGQGDQVSVVLRNTLDTPVSLEIPGVSFGQGARVTAPPDGTATATFTASAPGTYLYQGTERQLPMGLYGALIVRPAVAGRAYEPASTAYDREAPLVLSAIDPAFNAAPLSADLYRYAPKFWLVNGKAYPDTDPVHGVAPGTKVLLRYLNAGFDNTTMRLLGAYERVIARDARPLAAPFDATAETIPAGGTEDAVVTVPASGTRFPLYNRQLHKTMLTFLQIP